MSNVIDYVECPPRLFLQLAEMADERGNRRLADVWRANYRRVIKEEPGWN